MRPPTSNPNKKSSKTANIHPMILKNKRICPPSPSQQLDIIHHRKTRRSHVRKRATTIKHYAGIQFNALKSKWEAILNMKNGFESNN